MTDALKRLVADGPPDSDAIDRFISDNRFPLIRPNGAVVVFRGNVDRVALRIWIHGLPASLPLERLDGTDLWFTELDLPENSRVEYKLEVHDGDDSRWITDPLNPLTASDPFGNNSVLRGHGYTRPDWTLPDAEARAGHIEPTTIDSRVFDGQRQVQVYLPARFRRRRQYPLLVVHDGSDFLTYAALATVLDNLIHRLLIPPMVVALTDPGDRLIEYAGDTRHADHLATELIPQLERSLPLEGTPSTRGLMGASFGAVASLHAAWRHPGYFGRLLLASGSFAFSDIGPHSRGPTFDPVVEFINAFRNDPGPCAKRMFLSCGIYESLIYENRSMLPLLRDAGVQVRYEEVRDGHNWENWRDRLKSALSWLYHGPYWMVYE